MNFQRVAAVGFFDVEGAHQRVSGLGIDVGVLEMAHAFLVLPAGIPGLGNHGVAGVNMGDRFFMRGKYARVMVRVNRDRLGQQGTERKQREHEVQFSETLAPAQ